MSLRDTEYFSTRGAKFCVTINTPLARREQTLPFFSVFFFPCETPRGGKDLALRDTNLGGIFCPCMRTDPARAQADRLSPISCSKTLPHERRRADANVRDSISSGKRVCMLGDTFLHVDMQNVRFACEGGGINPS